MPAEFEPPSGLWLPLITPFCDDRIDATSLRRLIRHYAGKPVDGLILGATTGEGLTLDDAEIEQLVMVTADALREIGWQVPLYLGASQQGLMQHFEALADSTVRPIMIYNIPYRTGVNLGNETMLRLAARTNVVGVKDCCADTLQSVELLRKRPPGFAVLTGEDALFYGALIRGSDGGILASAHVQTEAFAALRPYVQAGNLRRASAEWYALSEIARLLFAEPSPAPLKYWLWRAGLIDSPEVRLPMIPIGADLAARIDRRISPVKSNAYAPRTAAEPAC